MISVYILTYNEEIDIADCIKSALLSDDVIVVDSFSTDRTIEIASQYPVKVVQHKFESHGRQRTWMLQELETKYEWVYILEADERMTPELFAECLEATKLAKCDRLLCSRKSYVHGEMDSLTALNIPVIKCVYFKREKFGFTIMVTQKEKCATEKQIFCKKPIPTTLLVKV